MTIYSHKPPLKEKNIVLVLNDIRSTYNVGAITRSAECLGIKKIFATGYTPYTFSNGIKHPPHIMNKMVSAINKTALGAEKTLPVVRHDDIFELLNTYKKLNYIVAALEQNDSSIPINEANKYNDLVLVLGEEVRGITANILDISDVILEIPMIGSKESFNVSVAASIALYELNRDLLIEQ